MAIAISVFCDTAVIAQNDENEEPSTRRASVQRNLNLDVNAPFNWTHTPVDISSSIHPGDSKFYLESLERERINRLQRETISRERSYQRGTQSNTGNSYGYGFCTWYVKEKSQSAQNGWGNAKNWPVNSSQPVAGGVVKLRSYDQRGHVGYVEGVEGNTIRISEMNYVGWNRVSYRTLNINDRSIIGFIN